MRIIFFNIFLLFLPAALYLSYVYVMKIMSPDKKVSNAPLFWLVVTGVVLMLAGLLTFGNLQENTRKGKYHPPEVRDGKIIPGYVE